MFGIVASPMHSMEFNVVDAALDRNKPTSFLGMMALHNKIKQEKQQQALEKHLQVLKEAINTQYKEFDKDEYTSDEVCQKTKFLAYITTFGEKERLELFLNSNPSSPNTVAYSPRIAVKGIEKTSIHYIPKKK